jgi:precorrin-6A/cobalt-precorrin-6A reductase
MTRPPNILLLGGTADAMRLAQSLAEAGHLATYSIAGRTTAPSLPPLPHRIGGFGGVEGLLAYLRAEAITHVIDATPPFAAQMSQHAAQACTALDLPLIALERAPWIAGSGDNWRFFKNIPTMATALPLRQTRIFLAIGRQNLTDFADQPQHQYLLRLIDPPGELPLPYAQVVLSKGPFTLDGDLALMRAHGTQLVIAKNAGGEAARAKLDAARTLGLPVWLAERPQIPARDRAETGAQVMSWLTRHPARLGV